jgi:diaminohydroxyphosphoribosylaminopyrimidine deaminase/5-amino-6-(5-phosphoribosylamino)uracil reductase
LSNAENQKRLREDYEELQKSKERLTFLFAELARRGITSLLAEGGGTLLGSLFDAKLLDEIHVFIAPKIIGGKDAVLPVKGTGIAEMADSLNLETPVIETVGNDIYVHGKLP